MRKVSRKQIRTYWNNFFGQTKKEFFKLEVLQDYSGEDNSQSLNAFLRGDIKNGLRLLKIEADRSKPWINPELKLIKRRVHIVKIPLSRYIQWEINAYRLYNIPKVKEKIFLISLENVKKSSIKLPKGDVLIFDNKVVMEHKYNKKLGKAMSSKIYDKPEEVKKYLVLKNKLIRRALPLDKFLKKYNLRNLY